MADDRKAGAKKADANRAGAKKGATTAADRKAAERDELVAKLEAMSVDKHSPDGAVSVSVNTDGVLTSLRLGDGVARMSPSEIANAVLQTYSQAQRESAKRTGEALGPMAGKGYVGQRLVWRFRFQPEPQPPSTTTPRRAARPRRAPEPPPTASAEPSAPPFTAPSSTAPPPVSVLTPAATQRPVPAGTPLPAESSNPEDKRNRYLKDRSVAGYDLRPPVPEEMPRPSTDDDFYTGEFRIKGRR